MTLPKNKSITIKAPPRTERDIQTDVQRKLVFMAIATNPKLKPDGTFEEALQYIANLILDGNLDKVKTAVEKLRADDDLILVQDKRRDPATGKPLPNIYRTIPIAEFWAREWSRRWEKRTAGTKSLQPHGKTHGDESPSKQSQVPSDSITSSTGLSTPSEGGEIHGDTHKSAVYRGSKQGTVIAVDSIPVTVYGSSNPAVVSRTQPEPEVYPDIFICADEDCTNQVEVKGGKCYRHEEEQC